MKAEQVQQMTAILFGVNLLFAFILTFKKRFLHILSLSAPLAVLIFLFSLWIINGRPPLKTLGETRLWYAALLPSLSFVFGFRFKLHWLQQFSFFMSSLFLLINVLSPDVYDKTLAPALQSYWFVPHVVVYIIAYALLAAAFMIALKECFHLHFRSETRDEHLARMDDILRIGFFFLTAGLVFGAFWAKEAWGHYWTWDPKETWAFISWAFFLFYFHLRHWYPRNKKMALYMVISSFIVLLVCWFGLNYMSIGQNSVHTYNNS